MNINTNYQQQMRNQKPNNLLDKNCKFKKWIRLSKCLFTILYIKESLSKLSESIIAI